MIKHERQSDFRARLQRQMGLAEQPVTTRRGSWLNFSCGEQVYDIADPRHVGTVLAVTRATLIVRWNKTGWRGEIDLADAKREKK